MSPSVKIRSDVKVSCYAYEGIEAIKKALKSGLGCATAEMPVKINLITPPLYSSYFLNYLSIGVAIYLPTYLLIFRPRH